MSTLKDAFHIDNLRRAWRWVRTNPEATYKEYCRDFYTAYAIADEAAITDLAARLKRGVYEPSHSCKIFFPKSSGILRPYSLLTVEDQIAYQAMINVVAENLLPRVRRRYNTEVFGHLYAGKSSMWFYRRWRDGYRHFNQAARDAFADGFRFAASFDLTACYDSIDHGVLSHFLRKIGCDAEFTETLTDWLSVWTATNHRIYHNHGIPQGPLASGLLAEVVLQHFDANRRATKAVRYMRYVDDIRMFAKSPDSLRQMLIHLDMLSKDVGLFPQSSKVHIHEVKDIEQELKSVSNPPEPVLTRKLINQDRLRERLRELSPKYHVSNTTRFKYLLARAVPSAKLNQRLWRILDDQPDLYVPIFRYFREYKRLPPNDSARFLAEVKKEPLYSAIGADALRTIAGRLRSHDDATLSRVIQRRWRPNGLQADLAAVLGRLAIERGLLAFSKLQYAVQRIREGWVRACVVQAIHSNHIGQPSMDGLINLALRDKEGDVAMMAASNAAISGATVFKPLREIHRRAGMILRAAGAISKLPPAACGIQQSMCRMLGNSVASIDWRRIFGNDYRQAERQVVMCRALADTNITAWGPAMDVFMDLLLFRLHQHDPNLGSYVLGNIGGILNSKRLATHYPCTLKLAQSLHTKRLESLIVHPRVRQTGKRTGPLKHAYLRTAKAMMRAAFLEVDRHW